MRRLRARTLSLTLVLSAPLLVAQAPQAQEPWHPPLLWPIPSYTPQTNSATTHPDDLAGLTITLRRGPCLILCPAYNVTISSDGTVRFLGFSNTFEGGSAMLLPGAHTAYISGGKFRELLGLFRENHFFDPEDRYIIGSKDRYSHAVQGSDLKVSLDITGLPEKIYHYYTGPVPADIQEIAAQIDEAVDTNRWLKGDAATLPSLLAEDWQFGSNDSQNMAVYRAVIQQRNRQLIDLYLQAHAPIVAPMFMQDSPVCVATEIVDIDLVHRMTDNPASLPAAVRWQCLRSAVLAGSLPMAQLWLDAGADPTIPLPPAPGFYPMEMVEAAIAGGNPDIVRMMLDRKLPLNDTGAYGPLLILLLSRSQPMPRLKELFQLLIAHGVNLDARDREGNTALMQAHGYHHDEVIPLLLAAGADINTRNIFGLTLLLEYADDEKFVRTLLEAGADPTIASNDGKTVLDYAREAECGPCISLIEYAIAKRKAQSTAY